MHPNYTAFVERDDVVISYVACMPLLPLKDEFSAYVALATVLGRFQRAMPGHVAFLHGIERSMRTDCFLCPLPPWLKHTYL